MRNVPLLLNLTPIFLNLCSLAHYVNRKKNLHTPLSQKKPTKGRTTSADNEKNFQKTPFSPLVDYPIFYFFEREGTRDDAIALRVVVGDGRRPKFLCAAPPSRRRRQAI
jgi:hypothetical protein